MMDPDQNTSNVKNTATANSENTEGGGSLNCTSKEQMRKGDSGIHVDKDNLSSEDDQDVAAPILVPEVSPSTTSSADNGSLGSPDSGNQENSGSSDGFPEITFLDIVKKYNEAPIPREMQKAVDDEKFDPTPKTEKPTYKWNVTLSTLKRQYGMPQNFSSDLFRYRCYGSMHMAERLELMYKMKGHEGCVNSLHFNATGTKLASGSDDLDVIVWDWATSEILLEFSSGHRSNVFQSRFLPFCGDTQIVTCARDGQIRLAELTESGASTKKLAQHRGASHKLALQMDSPHTFLSCGEDAVVYEMDLRESKPHKLLTCKENQKKVALYSIMLNPRNSYEYVIGGRDEYTRIYDKRFIHENDGLLKKFCPKELVPGNGKINVTSVVYNYNGSEILVSYNDDIVYLFDINASDTSTYLHRYLGHRNTQTVKGINFFGPKSEFVISGSDCGYIFFWEKESEHIIKYMHGDEAGVVNCLEPNPMMPVLATCGLDDDIKIWVPSAETPPDLSNLRKHLIRNMRDREEEKLSEPETFDDQVLWFLMQHLRRSRRRVRRCFLSVSQSVGAEESSTNSSSGDDDDDDNNHDDDDDINDDDDHSDDREDVEELDSNRTPIQCNPS